MDTDIKCPYCGQIVLKNVVYSAGTRFSAKHKCRRCKRIFPINLEAGVTKVIDTQG